MIAGGGEQVTLRLVAQYGDLCNVQYSPDEVVRKYGILAGHCAAVGRGTWDVGSGTREVGGVLSEAIEIAAMPEFSRRRVYAGLRP
jgi:hypothetical protein